MTVDLAPDPAVPAGATAAIVPADAIAQVRRMLAAGASRRALLTRLAEAGERIAAGDVTVSILFLDDDGLLRDGASPKLPADYLQAIDGLEPAAGLGTCASAAATGRIVFTPDFRADDKWAELRHLPLALGYVAAWSMPIKAADGRVLGTYGTYFRQPRLPNADEQHHVARLAEAAALVLASPILEE